MDTHNQRRALLRYRFHRIGDRPYSTADSIVETCQEVIHYREDWRLELQGTLEEIASRTGIRPDAFSVDDLLPERSNDEKLAAIIADFDKGTVDYLTEPWVQFRQRLIPLVAYGEYLSTLPASDIERMYHVDYALHQLAGRSEAAQQEASAFFNEPRANAPYSYYRGHAYWNPEEAVALSLGKDPRVVNRESLQPSTAANYFGKKIDPTSPSPFREEFARRLELTRRAIEVGRFAEKIEPSAFVQWAQAIDLSLPDELVDIATPSSRTAEEVQDLKAALAAERELVDALRRELTADDIDAQNPKSVKSLYRLLVGISASCFGFGAPGKSSAAKQIEGLLNDLTVYYSDKNTPNDVRLDEDTINKWLNRAKQSIGFALREPIKPIDRRRIRDPST